MNDVATRVARGAAWLDDKYPDWFKVIDLATLDISDCYQCVLGQVYTGCIPAEERGQLIAQVAKAYEESQGDYGVDWPKQVGGWGGYNVLNEFHTLLESGRPYGFLAQRNIFDDIEDLDEDYQALLDEWTRVIIDRRLAQHPETLAPIESFLADPSTGVRRERPTREPELVG